ncbi:MAG: D-2-hydroxyacid dehydrogenase [Verrucomicrobia bacterium]|nr:D-2-hydroxyacid dehydrogenase [Verrucomicrobiota bacterium]
MMKIVVLDAAPLGLNDISWASIEALGEVAIHERTTPEELDTRARGAQAILTLRVPFNRECLRRLTDLRYIGVLGSDPSIINVDAARKRNITVNWTDGIDTDSVAQHTIALLLELTHGVGRHAHTVRNGRWSRAHDFTFRLQPLLELSGTTLGIIGFGRIGQAVARVARALGMNVVACDPALSSSPAEGVSIAPLEEVLAAADVVSLHCPHTPQTDRLINQDTLARMKPAAYLLNTAHGALVDEEALATALRDRKLGGAGLDVLSAEPASPKNPLLRAPRCIITPHLAWATRAARQRIINRAAEQLRAAGMS